MVIRAHKRFAVCRTASICAGRRKPLDALLIEVSLEGCRLSNLGNRTYKIDELVTIRIDGFVDMDAQVRWLKDGFVGLRLVRALHNAELDRLIRLCRGEFDAPLEQRAYGT